MDRTDVAKFIHNAVPLRRTANWADMTEVQRLTFLALADHLMVHLATPLPVAPPFVDSIVTSEHHKLIKGERYEVRIFGRVFANCLCVAVGENQAWMERGLILADDVPWQALRVSTDHLSPARPLNVTIDDEIAYLMHNFTQTERKVLVAKISQMKEWDRGKSD